MPAEEQPEPDPIQAHIIEDLEAVRKELRIFFARTEVDSGPLPHPQSLGQYNDAVTDGADRIMSDWEKQGEHERTMDRMEHEMQYFSLQREARLANRGQWLGFAVAIFCFAVSAGLVLHGDSWAGGVLGSVDIVALVTVFVARNRAPNIPPSSEAPEITTTTRQRPDPPSKDESD